MTSCGAALRGPAWKPWPKAIDLFPGAGSATAALKAAHFRVLAAVDNDPAACAVAFDS